MRAKKQVAKSQKQKKGAAAPPRRAKLWPLKDSSALLFSGKKVKVPADFSTVLFEDFAATDNDQVERMGMLFGKTVGGATAVHVCVIPEHEASATWCQVTEDGTTKLCAQARDLEKRGLRMVGWAHSHHTMFAPTPSVADIAAAKSMGEEGEIMIILAREAGQLHTVAWRLLADNADSEDPLRSVEMLATEQCAGSLELIALGDTVIRM